MQKYCTERWICCSTGTYRFWDLSLDFDGLGQFNAKCSSMYRKAEQVKMKVEFEILKNTWDMHGTVTVTVKCNWSFYRDTCWNSEILKSNWCVSRYWCSLNAGLTPPHSLLLSKFFLLPSGWLEQWWTALWSLMMMMKKLPHLLPVHMLQPASQKRLWRISCHIQHTSRSLRLPRQRRTFMSCKWRMKNCSRMYVCYECLPSIITYFMLKMSIFCIIYLLHIVKISNGTR